MRSRKPIFMSILRYIHERGKTNFEQKCCHQLMAARQPCLGLFLAGVGEIQKVYPIRHIKTGKCCKKWSKVLHIYLGTSETEYRVKLENIVKKWRKALVNYLNFCAIYYVFANFSWCASIQMVAGKTTWPNFDLFKNFRVNMYIASIYYL